MKKSELVNLIREELRGWSPQVGQTKGLTPDTLNKILKRIASDDDYTPDAEVEEGAGTWPEEVPSRHGDIIFKLVKVMSDRAKYALIDAETGKEWEPGGRVYNTPDQVKAAAADTIKPQGGRQSSHFGTNEDKSDAIRWFGNLKYYYQKAFTELKGEDRETYKQLAKEFFSKLEIDQKVRPVGLDEDKK